MLDADAHQVLESPHGDGSEEGAFGGEAGTEMGPAAARHAEDVLSGHRNIVQEDLAEVEAADAQLVQRAQLNPFGAGIDHQERDAFARRGRGVGADCRDHGVGDRGAGDEQLLPGDQIGVALEAARGAQGRGVRARAGLGEGERHCGLAASDARQPALFLIVAAQAGDGVCVEQSAYAGALGLIAPTATTIISCGIHWPTFRDLWLPSRNVRFFELRIKSVSNFITSRRTIRGTCQLTGEQSYRGQLSAPTMM